MFKTVLIVTVTGVAMGLAMLTAIDTFVDFKGSVMVLLARMLAWDACIP